MKNVEITENPFNISVFADNKQLRPDESVKTFVILHELWPSIHILSGC